jgi:hypothetical protein
MKMTLLSMPEGINATGERVPATGWWRNQHRETVRFRQGAIFRACQNGDDAVWVLVLAAGNAVETG